MNLNQMNLTRLNLQQPSYPSSKLGRSTFFKSLNDTTDLPYNKKYDNCQNDLCYTYSKNYIYQPHTAYGMVGTTATSYLARRHRL